MWFLRVKFRKPPLLVNRRKGEGQPRGSPSQRDTGSLGPPQATVHFVNASPRSRPWHCRSRLTLPPLLNLWMCAVATLGMTKHAAIIPINPRKNLKPHCYPAARAKHLAPGFLKVTHWPLSGKLRDSRQAGLDPVRLQRKRPKRDALGALALLVLPAQDPAHFVPIHSHARREVT